ncbi:hypothetical protein ACLB2K_013423 [Fragaria x ananassa]
MKQPYIYLSVLIDGPQAPGDKIDVYLQPLIEELKELWEEGVPTFDTSSNQMFQLYAGLLWTINDFPAYANLSGVEYKSRRFSPEDHKYRRDAKSFNGLREYRQAPPTLYGVDLLAQIQSNGVITQYKKEDMLTRQDMGPKRPEKDPLKKKKHN